MPTTKGAALAPLLAIAALAVPVHLRAQVQPSPAAAAAQPDDQAMGTAIATSADEARRMTVAVTVNNTGPYHFLIDTGANRTVVSDRLAAALQLPPRPSARLVSITDTEDVAMAALDSLEVGGLRREDFDAAVLGEGPLGATGVLGIDNLASRRVVLDFRRNAMSISDAQHLKSADRDPPGTIVVTARRQEGQLILTDAWYRGHRIDVVLDTGAEVSIGNLAFLDLVERRTPDLPIETVTSVTGKTASVRLARLPAVTLDRMNLNQTPVVFGDLACFGRFGLASRPALLLGMDVLRRFDRVAIDFRRRIVSFSMPESNGPSVRLMT